MFSSFTIDIKKIPIYLLIGYIFFAFLINYPSLVIYENIFLLFFIASVFLSIEIKNITISPLILIYGLLSLISTINNLFLYDRYGINKSIITMPLIFLAMVACRSISQAGLFIKLIIINAVPYILLLPIGGHIEWGRYYSYFVSENLQGIVLPFTFSVGLYLAYGRKLFFGAIVCISVPLFLFVVSARRSLLSYFLVSIFIFLVSQTIF